MACTITNLAPLGRPCTPQMGGVKCLYLLSMPGLRLIGTGGAAIALNNFVYDEDGGKYSGWGIFAESSDVGAAQDIEDLAAVLEEITADTNLDYYFQRIDVTRQGAVVTSELQHNRENGSDYYLNSVVIPTAGLTPAAIELLHKLGRGGCIVVAETYTGQLVAFGFEERATLSEAAVTTGANWGDMPGATITLSSEEKYPVTPDVNLCDDGGFYQDGPAGILPLFKKYLVKTA